MTICRCSEGCVRMRAQSETAFIVGHGYFMALTRELVIEAAFDLLQEKGLVGLSLRNLASKLDIKAPSLSWHIQNKSTLISLMNQNLFIRVLQEVPTSVSGPSEWLYEFGLSIWRQQNRVRNSAALINADSCNDDVNEETQALLLERLDPYDLNNEDGIVMQSAVQALITGWSTFKQSQQMPYIASMIDIDRSVERSLRALVDGFFPP